MQSGGPDSDDPDLTNLLLDEPINAPNTDAAAPAANSCTATSAVPVIAVAPLFSMISTLVVPLIHEVVVMPRASDTATAATTPYAAPHELRAAHLGLETESATPGRGRDHLSVVVAPGHVVNHAARVADGRHGRNPDLGG